MTSTSNDLFVIAKADANDLVTSILTAGRDETDEAVLIFTTSSKADLYIQQAQWMGTETAARLQPESVVRWLQSANHAGIRFVAVDPDRIWQRDGIRQRVFEIGGLLNHDADTIVKTLCKAIEPISH